MKREERIRRRLGESGPYFQFAPGKQEDWGAGKLKEAVRALQERIDKLNNRVCVCVFWKVVRRKGRPRRTNVGETGDGRVVVGGSKSLLPEACA